MSRKKVLVVGNQYGVTELFRLKAANFQVLIDDEKESPDLLVFTGGQDISTKFYGQEKLPETQSPSRYRDDQDLEYWNLYPELPKIGICRGAQFLNVMSGGSLWQHVNNHGSSHLIHNLLLTPEISERSLMVSSMHHQMMIPGADGEVLAIATSHRPLDKKGIATVYKSPVRTDTPEYDVEIVWYPKTKCLCIQSHPEYRDHEEERKYFFKLVKHFFE